MTLRLAFGCFALCGCALIDAVGKSGDDTPGGDGSVPGSCSDPAAGFNGCRIADCDGRLTLNGPESAAKLVRVLGPSIDDVVASTTKQGVISIQIVSAGGAVGTARQLDVAPADDAPIIAFAGGSVGYAFILADTSIEVALSDASGTPGTAGILGTARAFGKVILIQTTVDGRAALVWADTQSMTLRFATVLFGTPSTITNEQQLATLVSLPTNPLDFELEATVVAGGTKAFAVWTEDAGQAFLVGFDAASGSVLHPKIPAAVGPAETPRPRIAATPNAGGALLTFISSNSDLTARRIDDFGVISMPKIVAAVTIPTEAALIAIDNAVIEIMHGPGNIVRFYAMSFDGITTRGVETLPLIPGGDSCGPIAAVAATSTSPAMITYGRCDDNRREVDRLFCPGN